MTNRDGDTDKKSHLRRSLEVLGWIGLVALLWGSDLLAKFAERDQTGIGKDNFRLVSEQVTSGIAVLLMVLFLVQWLRLFPIRMSEWPRAIIGHTIGSVIFAFGHFALMIALRIPWYALNGYQFVWREPFVANLIVEYQKDIKIYIGFVLVLVAYKHFARTEPPAVKAPTDRLVVSTGSGDAIVRLVEIECLEAARNYIAVHVGDREYVLRETLRNLLQRLGESDFIQTHRSYAVNIEQVREIRNVDSAQRVVLQSGREVPLSRSYREAFNNRVVGKA